MPGTSPGMTTFDMMPHSMGCILSQTLRMRSRDYGDLTRTKESLT
jgi:hypothetical protein